MGPGTLIQHQHDPSIFLKVESIKTEASLLLVPRSGGPQFQFIQGQSGRGGTGINKPHCGMALISRTKTGAANEETTACWRGGRDREKTPAHKLRPAAGQCSADGSTPSARL